MDVQLTRYMFTGMKADITKVGSMSPSVFHMTHSFAQGSPMLPAYTLMAAYATNRIFMTGQVDNDYSVSGRLNYGWASENSRHTTKLQTQTTADPAGQSMLQIEHDWRGDDFNVNIKTINPSILDGEFSAVSVLHYLQSVTPSLALGVEAIWQKPTSTAGVEETAVAYVGRYVQPTWIASAHISPQGVLNATFWKRLSQKVEAGVECQLMKAVGPMGQVRSEGITTISTKYDYALSTLRGQIDTKGKLQCLLERRISPAVGLTFAGTIDHFKNTATVGLGLSMEMPAFDDPSMPQ